MANQCKFYKQKKQWKYVEDVTWLDVYPAEYQKGEIYEYQSADCPNVRTETQWVDMDINTYYECSGTSKYYKQKEQTRNCTGSTCTEWVDTGNYRIGNLYETNSEDCGGDANANYPFTIRNLYNDYSHITITRYSSVNASFKYSTDEGNTYTGLNGSGSKSVQVSLAPNQTVKIISDILYWSNGSIGIGVPHIYGAEGNILSLSMGDNYNDSNNHTIEGNVNRMFRVEQGTSYLRDASKLSFGKNLILKADNFKGMFSGCTYLQKAPKILPSTEVPSGAYESMFYGCHSLVNGVEYILGESFSGSALSSMFYECSGLTTAPIITADEIVDTKTNHMFWKCYSLANVPKPYNLKYTYSYCAATERMFSNCSGLITSPVAKLDINVTSSSSTCSDMAGGMFENCTGLTATPVVTITGIKKKHNFSFFCSGCYSLKQAIILTPEFDEVSTGNLADAYETTAMYPHNSMFYPVSNSGIFYKSSGTTWSNTPSGWSVQNYTS